MERLVGKYLFDPEISAGKMVFLTGPRQIGKTTFAKNWLSSERVEDTYFDWMIRQSGASITGTLFISEISSTLSLREDLSP